MIEILQNNWFILSGVAIFIIATVLTIILRGAEQKKLALISLWIAIASFLITIISFLGASGIKFPSATPKNNFESIILSIDNVFDKGQYDEACVQYEDIYKYKDTLSIEQVIHLNTQIRKCNQASKFKTTADGYFNNKKYELAIIEYRKILEINFKDPNIEKQISKCENQIARIVAETEEKKNAEQREREEEKRREEAEHRRLKEIEQKRIAEEAEQRRREEMRNDTRLYRNGQKPMRLLILNNHNNGKFYIYSDDVIMYYDISTKDFFQCASKQTRIYESWSVNGNKNVGAWSFYLSLNNNLQETYTVSTNGEVWAKNTYGGFSQFGYIKVVDF
jgi:hypothetical protein